MQELLAKARAKLSSLQMQDIYDAMERNGDVIGVAYCYKKIVVTYKNKSKQVFQMWEWEAAVAAFSACGRFAPT